MPRTMTAAVEAKIRSRFAEECGCRSCVLIRELDAERAAACRSENLNTHRLRAFAEEVLAWKGRFDAERAKSQRLQEILRRALAGEPWVDDARAALYGPEEQR